MTRIDDHHIDNTAGIMVHAPVLGAEKSVPADQIPAEGPLALAPQNSEMAKNTLERYSSTLQKRFAGLKIQQGEGGVNDETRAIMWLDPSAKGLKTLDDLLDKHKNVGWVQLPMAGITHYLPVVQKYPERMWTSCKGAYSQPVAEHALMLALSLLRYLPMRLHATSWGPSKEATLFNAYILILGAGGITLSLLSLLAPFTPQVTVLRRKADPIEDRFVPPQLKDRLIVGTLADLDTHVSQADVVIVNCALTDETRGAIGRKQFDIMKKSSIIVNVARGEVINTDDLVIALQRGQIFGAGLDVTHPEPLPDNHPLWLLSTSHPEMNVPAEQGGQRANLIITPHVANTIITSVPLYEQRISRNVEAWLNRTGRFEGLVDAQAGY